MSKTVDSRVVEMRFDNKQFEANVQTSLSTLDRLKKSLKLDDASKGFDSIDKAVKKVSLDGIASGVESLQKRFSTFGIVGMRVLENLTDSAMNFATKTLGSVTESIVQGGKKRAMNIENAHFQLQGLLKDEAKVQAVMNDAMDSVDGTAYAYDSAAKAASQFAASGLQAGKQMQSSLRAITGVAAMTNSEYEDISRIFTTVAGNGRLMGEQLLQLSGRGLNAAATLADYMTKTGNGAKVTEAEVREMVSDGEISFKLFADAMDDAFGAHAKKANETFTGAMSNVKAALARIGAEFISPLVVQNGAMVKFFNALRLRVNDVKANIGPLAKLFVDTATTISNAATKYLTKLDLTKPFVVFYNVVDSVKNSLNGLWSVVKPIGQAFWDIFPPKTVKQAIDFTASLKTLTSRLKLSEEAAQNMRNTFKGLFAILDIVKRAAFAVVKGISSLFAPLNKVGGSVLSATGSFGELIVKLDDVVKKSDIFNKAIQGVVRFLQSIPGKVNGVFKSITGSSIGEAFDWIEGKASSFLAKIKEIFSGFRKVDTKGIDELSQKTTTAFKPMTTLFNGVISVLRGLWDFAKKLSPVFSAIATAIGTALSGIGNVVSKALNNADFDKLFDIANGGILVAIGVSLKKFVDGLAGVTKNASGFVESLKGIFKGVKGCLEEMQKDIKANAILKIAKAIGILAVSLVVLSAIDPDELLTALGSISLLFVELSATMKAMSKTGDVSVKNSVSMVAMSTAVLILASALKKLSSISFGDLMTGMIGLAGISAILVVTAKQLSKSSKDMIKGATGLIAFAIAVRLLVKPVKELGALDLGALAKGLVAVGVLCAELALFLKTANLDKIGFSKGLGLIALAGAIDILAIAVGKFAALDTVALVKGLAGVGVVLAEVVAFTKLIGNPKGLIVTAAGMTILGSAMIIFGKAISNIGQLSWEEIAKGLVGIGAALIGVAAAMKLMPDGGKMILASTGMVLVATSMKIFASAIMGIASLTWEDLAKGLTAMAVSLASVVIAMKLMDSGALKGAAAVLVCAAALNMFVPVLKALGNMEWEDIAKGLVAIAGVFVILGVAGYALKPVVTTILALSGAMALMGLAAVAFGAGLLATSIALSAFAGSAEVIVDAVIVMLIRLITAIPNAVEELAKSLGTALPAIVECLVSIAKAGLLALNEVVPLAVEVLLNTIQEVLKSLAAHIQPIIESLLDIVVGVIEGLASGIPKVVASTIKLFKAIIEAIFDALGGFDIGTILKATAALTALGVMMTLLTVIAAEAVIATAVLPIIGKNLNKFIEEIRPFLAEIQKVDPASLQGAKNLAETVLILTASGILDGLTSWFTGGNSMLKFGEQLAAFAPYLKQYYMGIKGIDAGVVEASANAAKALAEMATNLPNSGGVVSWFTGDNSLSDFAEELTVFGPKLKAYANSVKGLDSAVVVNSAMAALAMAELAKKLPNSGGVISWFAGDNSLADFAEELSLFGPKLKEYANSVDGIKPGVVESSANAAMALAELADNLPDNGGLVSWFTGDNNLASFAEELSAFGPALKEYADSVEGLDAELVVNSAHAAEALAALADKLPNSGGVVSWFAGDNSLADFAEELAEFGPKLKEYSDSVKGLDSVVVINSAMAAQALAQLANNLPNSGGVVSWFSGDNTLSQFAEELSAFGPELKKYADSVKGLDAEVVIDSVNAAKALAEFAENVPNSGGLAAVFSGDNTLSQFAEELAAFGPSLKKYADSIEGLDGQVVVESADAAMAIANLANNLPNSGGLVSVFTGDNTLSQFAEELSAFGPALKKYADSIEGLDSEVVINSVNAAKALAELAGNLPSVGGIGTVFTGDSSLSTFAKELSEFGPAFKTYGNSLKGLDMEVVETSANAAKALAQMVAYLPETGGITSWFTGEQSLSTFAEELASFGPSLKLYAQSVEGLDSDVVVSSANASKALLEMATYLPDSGGIASWFTGEQSLSDFAKELVEFGPLLKEYADSIEGLNAGAVLASSIAAKSLFEIASNLPKQGGIVSWLTGKQSLASFAKELALFGPSLKVYAKSVEGLDTEIVANSANAAKSLFEMSSNLPKKGGLLDWFTGEQSLTVFGEELTKFGPSLKKYSDSIEGLNPDTVLGSANGAKVLAEMASNLPKKGGMSDWFTGEQSLSTFAEELTKFGPSLKTYSKSIEGLDPDVVTNSAKAAKSLTELANNLPKKGSWFSDESTLEDFGKVLSKFGSFFKEYYSNVKEINTKTLSAVIKETKNLISMAKSMSGVDSKSVSGFGEALKKLGKSGVDGFISAFTKAKSRVTDAAHTMVTTFADAANDKRDYMTTMFNSLLEAALATIKGKQAKFKSFAKTLMNEFINGIKAKETDIKNAIVKTVNNALIGIKNRNKYDAFIDAGKYLVKGFAEGISANTFMAKARATTMAKAAIDAAKEALKIQSPSKEFYSVGDYAGQGFVNALGDYCVKSYSAGREMANAAKDGLNKAISKVSDVIRNGIDTTPTIRPVMDLTDIQNGTNQLYRLMSGVDGYSMTGSIDLANRTASGIERRMQMRSDRDIAFDELGKTLDKLSSNQSRTFKNTFNITGDNPKEIAEEVSRIIQRQIERRDASWA